MPHASRTRSMTSGLSGSPALDALAERLASAAPRSAWMSIRHTVGGAQSVLTPRAERAAAALPAENRS